MIKTIAKGIGTGIATVAVGIYWIIAMGIMLEIYHYFFFGTWL